MLEALPGQEQKDQLLEALSAVCDPQQLGLAVLQGINVNHLVAALPTPTWPAWPLDVLSSVPDLAALLVQIQQIVAQLGTLVTIIRLDDIATNILGTLTLPPFPFQEVITSIPPTLFPPLTWAAASPAQDEATHTLLAFSGLDQLPNGGALHDAAQPWERLAALLHVVTDVVQQISDPNNLGSFASQRVQASYLARIRAVDAQLPLVTLEKALACYQPSAEAGNFVAAYQQLLEEWAGSGEPTPADLRQWTVTSAAVQAALQTLTNAGQTLAALQAHDLQPFTTAVAQLLTPEGTAAQFYQPLFAQWAQPLRQWIDAAGALVQQLGAGAEQIQAYSAAVIATAEAAAQQLARQIETLLATITQLLATCQAGLLAVAAPLETWVAALDVMPLVEQVKVGCAQVGTAVDHGLALLEEVKWQLDQGVASLQTQVDTQLTHALQTLETELRALLSTITTVLNRADAQAVFEQVRQWIEKFTRVVEQTTLKPIFDLVLTKTNELESSIKAIPVAQLGLPQRTALKAGAQILKEVQVDEQIRPELLDRFAQVCTPVAELLALVSEKVLLLEQAVYTFNPGTLAQELIENTGPYQQLMAALDAFRPSQIFVPLQELNATLAALVEQIDPGQWPKPLQTLYTELAALLTVLDPVVIKRLLDETLALPLAQLTHLRDQELAELWQAIQQQLSLATLLPGTGVPLASVTAVWSQLIALLGGADLAKIEAALAQAETTLAQETTDYSQPLAYLPTTLANLDRQQATAADAISGQLRDLQAYLVATDWAALQARRAALLAQADTPLVISQLLQPLDLQPVLQLQATVTALLELAPETLSAALTTLADALPAAGATLQAITPATLQSAAPAIFRQQLGDPLRQLVAQARTQLAPLAPAVEDLQALLAELLALPAKLDAAVAAALAPTQAQLAALLTESINTLQAFGDTVAQLLQTSYTHLVQNVAQLSPVWLLNVFGAPDFMHDFVHEGGATGTPAGLVRMAGRIAQGAAEGDLHLAEQLQAQLSASEVAALQGELGSAPPATLSQSACSLVYQALNRLLADGQELPASDVAAIQRNLQAQLDTAIDPQLGLPEQSAANQRRYRLQALQKQLHASATAYQASQQPPDLLRWKRVLLEAAYPDDLALSLPSLYPYLVVQIAQLYPEQTIQRLDALYGGIVAQVGQLPDLLIRAPLDDAFNEIKVILQENFDLSDLFALLLRKVAGLDKDLVTGLDRLSAAYQRLLRTLDQRLGATV